MEKGAQVQRKCYRIGDFENVKTNKELGVFPIHQEQNQGVEPKRR